MKEASSWTASATGYGRIARSSMIYLDAFRMKAEPGSALPSKQQSTVSHKISYQVRTWSVGMRVGTRRGFKSRMPYSQLPSGGTQHLRSKQKTASTLKADKFRFACPVNLCATPALRPRYACHIHASVPAVKLIVLASLPTTL